jgi:hypothetical protein
MLMSRIAAVGNLADVRWVHAGEVWRGHPRHSVALAHIRRGYPRRSARKVPRTHAWQIRRVRAVFHWLDDNHRHLIMPLALWDATEQIEAAARRFRLGSGP